MSIYDPLIHPALLDPRAWGDVNLYETALQIEREPVSGADHHTPDRRFELRHLRLGLRFDDEHETVAGTARLTLRPFSSNFTHFDLDAAEMNITSVKLLADQPASLSFETHTERLAVELPHAFSRDDEIIVEIAYSCRPRKGLFFIKPDDAYPHKPRQIWSQGENEDAHWWFPCSDVTNQKMTTELLATVRSDFFALSNGALIGATKNAEEGTTTWHWRQEQPHPAYLVSVVVGEYEHIADRCGELPIDYYVYRDRRDEGRRLFANTPRMLELFERLYGVKYPYPKYAQVLVDDFLFGAMENTSATTMTDRVLLDDRAAVEISYDDIVAHELAHQWWGDLVTCKDWSQIWLNESFATYSEYLWREHDRGRDEARFCLFQDFLVYLREDQRSHRRPIVCRRYRYSEELMDRHAYEKGACVLDMLRAELGDDGFFSSLAHYLEKHSFGVAETSDFKNAIEEATGRNLHWFFEQWILGAGYPELEIEYEWRREDAQLSIRVKQVQERADGAPLFRLPVEIEISTDAGRTNYRVVVEKQEQEFYFACSEKPLMVLFDKGHRVFKLMRFPKSAQELVYQLEHDGDMLGRVRAARELAAFKTDEAVQALGAKLTSGDFWGVRLAAATALGEIGGDSARKIIEAGLEMSGDARVRRGCVWALGRYKDEAAIDLLRGALDDDSYFVGVAAVRALANLGGDRAYDILGAALSRTSWQEVIRAAVFHGFSTAKEKRAVEVALSHARYGEHPAVRVAAIACLGALGKELRKEDRDDAIVDRLIELLTDRSIRARAGAIRALGRVGNRRGLGALREAQRRECLDQLRAAIEDAIGVLEKKETAEKKV